MKKVAIINCYKMSKNCSGLSCFNSINKKIDSFETYKEDGFEFVGFGHCNVCCTSTPDAILTRAENLKKVGTDVIHISSCIKKNCPNYNEFKNILSKDFDIVDYTHVIK